jgi:hypothetical protein
MLAGVIHLKSPLAETSKRTLRGMVEGKNRETTSPFSGHPTRPTSKVTLGYLHQQQSVPDGGKNLIVLQGLAQPGGQLPSPNPSDGTRSGSHEQRELSPSTPRDTAILTVSQRLFSQRKQHGRGCPALIAPLPRWLWHHRRPRRKFQSLAVSLGLSVLLSGSSAGRPQSECEACVSD